MSLLQAWAPSDKVLLWWISCGLQVTVITTSAFLAAKAAKRNAATRHSILCAALVLCLVSPISVIVSSQLGLPTLRLHRETQPRSCKPRVALVAQFRDTGQLDDCAASTDVRECTERSPATHRRSSIAFRQFDRASDVRALKRISKLANRG